MRHGLLLLGIAAAAAAVPADDKPTAVTIDMKLGDQLVARLHHSKGKDTPGPAKPYLWPLRAPGDVPVTRAWPMDPAGAKAKDHVHQKSAWFCHGDVIPEGVELTERVRGVEGVDFWSETKGHGRIVTVTVGGAHGGGTGALSYILVNHWLTAGGQRILTEQASYSVHDLGGARLIVARIRLTAEDCPITFGDTKEGSFGVRVHDQLSVKDGTGVITNAEGKTGEKECWGMLSKWCDYSGTVDGKPVGIAVFDHPANKYPACWHVRGYGLMAANPFGRKKSGFPAMKEHGDLVKLARGEELSLTYGILLHTGDVASGEVAKRYEEFVKLSK
jgi:hypothetical protein